MAKIACGVGECSHNKIGECYANVVSIAGDQAKTTIDTCCSSFLNQLVYAELTNNVISGNACDSLECHVQSCRHNNSCGCDLEHVKINGDNVNCYGETNCLSFEAKN